jgi:hypothetical protein
MERKKKVTKLFVAAAQTVVQHTETEQQRRGLIKEGSVLQYLFPK